MKKILRVSGYIMALLIVTSSGSNTVLGVETAYAAESVYGGCRWENVGGTSWKAKQADGSYLCNAWYQDIDGSWYFMKADGYMAEQIFTDTDGSVYLLDWRHEGTYGKLLTSGIYNGVYIQTNDAHDGTWGRILNTEVISQLEKSLNEDIDNSNYSGGATENQTNTENQIDDNGLIHSVKPGGVGGSTEGNQASFQGQ